MVKRAGTPGGDTFGHSMDGDHSELASNDIPFLWAYVSAVEPRGARIVKRFTTIKHETTDMSDAI